MGSMVPEEVLGFEDVGGESLWFQRKYAIGYSGVVFAYFVLSLFPSHDSYLHIGNCKFRKMWIPVLYLVINQIIIPQASFLGNFFKK